MKNLIIVLFTSLLTGKGTLAQSYKSIYYLDNNLASTDAANAIFIGRGKPADGYFLVDYFNKNGGQLLMSIHFIDSSLSNMAGLFSSFYLNGKKENEGNYKNNLEEGVWQKWDSSGNKTDSAVYRNGIRVIHASYEYAGKKLSSYEFLDSLNDSYRFIGYDSAGNKSSEADFSGKSGEYRTFDSGRVTKNQIFSRERVEAGFEGGDNGWRRYLQTNLNANIPVENGAGAGIYQVIIRFVINVDGSVSDIKPETSFGRGMEAEVIRIIRNSRKWKPAILFGIPVKAYRRQPVTFVVQ